MGILCRDFRRHVLGLGVAKRPNFIDLQPLALQITHDSILVLRAGRACIHRQLYNCVDVHASHPAGGTAERTTFDQSGYDSSAAGGIEGGSYGLLCLIRRAIRLKTFPRRNVGPVFSPVDTAEKREIEGADGKQREGPGGDGSG
jgi:hypothetical protein